jgi:hypothetical protein
MALKETGGLAGSQAPSAPVQLDGSSDRSDQHRLGKLRRRINSFVAIGADQSWPAMAMTTSTPTAHYCTHN